MNNESKWREAAREFENWITLEQKEMLYKQENNPKTQSNSWAMRKEQTAFIRNMFDRILQKHGLSLDECEHEMIDNTYVCARCGAEKP